MGLASQQDEGITLGKYGTDPDHKQVCMTWEEDDVGTEPMQVGLLTLSHHRGFFYPSPAEVQGVCVPSVCFKETGCPFLLASQNIKSLALWLNSI